ncbi:hypothetical protein ACIQ9K_04525 [Streptomyces microflavus]|uniref:hypothetical protein n=1 Tax=Streptomyces TaxID=1883 RepID=UPI000823E3A5|nr:MULTISPECIES: hypothetical protein [Streptomyces]SCK48605.1 hypothetical protein YUYDRAFT_06232 [Streptomyces sp. ScaeMP-e48]
MTVPAHPRSRRPAPSPRPAPSSRPALPRHPAADRVEIRLPWWAVALPAVAFAALLLMIMSPGQAQAATADPALGQLIERTLHLLSR